MRRIFILVAVLIVYGSLFPWNFEPHPLSEGPIRFLLGQWDRWSNAFLFRDIVINLILYCPLGAAGYLLLKEQRRSGRIAFFGPVLFGFTMSFLIELAQVYAPGRQPSAVDVVCNTAGSAIGAGTAALLWPRFTKEGKGRIGDTAAFLLSIAWLLFLLFPFVPVWSQPVIREKLTVFQASRVMAPVSMISSLGMWFAGGLILLGSGIAHPRRWLALTLPAVPLWIFIVDRQPLRSELLGALLGTGLFLLRDARRKVRKAEAWAFLAILILRAVWPLAYVAASNRFSLVPFANFMLMDGQIGLMILLQQACWYGTAVWLLHASGTRIGNATFIVAAAVSITEVAGRHLAGKTPGITAPLVAVLAAYVLFSFAVTKPALRSA